MLGEEEERHSWSVRGVAAILGRHRSTVYELIRRGELKVIAGVSPWRVSEAELERHIEALMYTPGEV